MKYVLLFGLCSASLLACEKQIINSPKFGKPTPINYMLAGFHPMVAYQMVFPRYSREQVMLKNLDEVTRSFGSLATFIIDQSKSQVDQQVAAAENRMDTIEKKNSENNALIEKITASMATERQWLLSSVNEMRQKAQDAENKLWHSQQEQKALEEKIQQLEHELADHKQVLLKSTQIGKLVSAMRLFRRDYKTREEFDQAKQAIAFNGWYPWKNGAQKASLWKYGVLEPVKEEKQQWETISQSPSMAVEVASNHSDVSYESYDAASDVDILPTIDDENEPADDQDFASIDSDIDDSEYSGKGDRDGDKLFPR